jgi:hypothetical protein
MSPDIWVQIQLWRQEGHLGGGSHVIDPQRNEKRLKMTRTSSEKLILAQAYVF